MSRLPIPGNDSGQWGQILNDFLSQSHNADGTLKAAAAPVQSVNGMTGAVVIPAADDNLLLHKAGAETVTGAKDFTGGLTVSGSQVATAANLANYYTAAQIDAQLRSTDAVIMYNTGTSSYPVRTSVTSDTSRPVRWRGPISPTIGGDYAIDNLDVWEMTS